MIVAVVFIGLLIVGVMLATGPMGSSYRTSGEGGTNRLSWIVLIIIVLALLFFFAKDNWAPM